MPKTKTSNEGTILHSLPSFNKADRLSVKVASLRLAQHMSDPDKMHDFTVDRRRNSPHRRTLGGRGREWAAESLKLLEALLELEDSQPIREPVNPLKFPDYYSQITNPLDLSKIMLKFHGGCYESLDAFAKDMRAMFGNYKGFFKEANSDIYTQVHRLSWWFETEIQRITETWGRKYQTMVLPKIRKVAAVAAGVSHDTEESVRVAAPTVADYPSDTGSYPNMPSGEVRRKRKRSKEPEHQGGPEPSNLLGSIRQQVMSGIAENYREERNSPVNLSRPPPPPPPPQPKDHRARTSILSHSRTHSDSLLAPLARLKPGTLAQLKGAQSRLTVSMSDQTLIGSSPELGESMDVTRIPDKPQAPTRTTRMDVDVLTLELSVSNIWFGAMRIKPKKQALLSETGLQVSLYNADQELPFTIHAEEMVRCVAHFGRSSQKHTLFIFVLPSCSKRLEALNEKYVNSNMIVIFLNLSSASQISTLIHIFWNIGRKSLFGSVFSEVDQQGALMLLGNIKPGILNRVTNKYKNSSTTVSQDSPEVAASSTGVDTVSRMLKKKRKTDMINRLAELNTLNNPSSEASEKEKDSVRTDATNAEPESSVMPDSSMSSTNDQESETSAAEASGTPKHFEKDFAERLGASLQQGFKEGFTEALKNLADTLYGKGLPTSGKDGEIMAKMPNTDVEEESDIEIVIPTDSEDEDSKKPLPQIEGNTQATGEAGEGEEEEEEEEELAVTGAKLSIRCPITQQIMVHPMKNRHCSHCYDRQGVEELIKNRKDKAKCPVAGCSNTTPLDMADMKYDYNIWKYIQEKSKNPHFKAEDN